jgi:chemosensory pili system protein ChpA (sensor histidine kinase/response regulator)
LPQTHFILHTSYFTLHTSHFTLHTSCFTLHTSYFSTMSQDKEREIQLQFLEEAIEYLDTIESVLLGLAGSHIDGQQMDAVLRAAHSVKGGAGMMGYQTLSQLAHRLEDSFKVLKAQRNSLAIDPDLESLLLAAVDRLRQVLTLNRQGTDVDEQWLVTVGSPVFDQLHDRLGDPVADDAATMLGAEDGTNVAALLFETEVEGCLNRLESVLADPQAPCLEEELSIMAQELGGLGEMLQLEAFTQLCESVIQCLEAAPGAVREIAASALAAWKKSQALVLVGQNNSLPTSIGWSGVETLVRETHSGTSFQETHPTQPISTPTWEELAASHWQQEDGIAEFDELEPTTGPTLPSFTQDDLLEEHMAIPTTSGSVSPVVPISPIPTQIDEQTWLPDELTASFDELAPTTAPTLPSVTQDDLLEEQVVLPTTSASLSREVQPVRRVEAQSLETSFPTADIQWREVKPSSAGGTQRLASGASPQPRPESQENTVRIPVRQLDRLNELFGELTIERNGLSLHLGRLRSLIETLSRRVSSLEQSNMRLRTAYDTVATVGAYWNTPLQGTFGRGITTENRGHLTGDWGQGRQGGFGNTASPANEFSPSLIPNSSSSIPNDNALLHNRGFDALEMDRYSDLHLLSMEVMETIVQIQEVTSDVGLSLEDTDSTARELNQTAKQLQTHLTRLRMRPLSDLVGRFSRALRDLCLQYGKQVELKVVGKGTLIDRSILEALSDPLMHLVRNAFDHGMEDPETRVASGKAAQGVIEIKAAHRGNQTIITVSDDGKGINLNKIRAKAEAMGLDAELLAAASEDDLLSLIFEPGFSTAERVTDLSGRGVGMDVVRNNLKQIRGDIRVDTTPGRGTTFTLTVPFTLSVARVLLVESNGMLLAFPTDVIEEMLLPSQGQIYQAPGSEVLKWEEEMIPLTRLSAWLTFYCPRRAATPEGVPSINEPTVLMISLGEQLHGIQVDRCWGEQEVAIRQVEGPLTMPPGFASCTILGDGKVVPLVDCASLLRWIKSERSPGRNVINHLPTTGSPEGSPYSSQELFDSSEASVEPFRQGISTNPPVAVDPINHKDSILVVDDSINVRRFLALALEKAGYLVEQAKDGQDAVEKLLGGCQVSAVICDIEMPRLDGYGFLARIKSDPEYERLPIAMLTSRTGDKHRQLAMTLGASAYFSKPYNERELLRTLKTMITESQERKPVPSGVR